MSKRIDQWDGKYSSNSVYNRNMKDNMIMTKPQHTTRIGNREGRRKNFVDFSAPLSNSLGATEILVV